MPNRESTRTPAASMLGLMAAAAHLSEVLPPVTAETRSRATLVAAPFYGELDRALDEAERLAADNHHDAAVRELEEVWDETRTDASLKLRHRLALSWAEMYRGNLDRAGELLQQAQMIVQSPRFDATDRAEVLHRQGCVALKSAEVADATSLFTRALETNDRSNQPSLRAGRERVRVALALSSASPRLEAARRDAERSLDSPPRPRRASKPARSSRHRSSPSASANGCSPATTPSRHSPCARSAATHSPRAHPQQHRRHLLPARRRRRGEAQARVAVTKADEAGSTADLAQAVSSLAQVYLRDRAPGRGARARGASGLTARGTHRLPRRARQRAAVVAKALAAEDDDEGAKVVARPGRPVIRGARLDEPHRRRVDRARRPRPRHGRPGRRPSSTGAPQMPSRTSTSDAKRR